MSLIGAEYNRVSTAQQREDGTSLDTQHAINQANAAKLGISIDPRFIWHEQGSGVDSTRPGYLALKNAVMHRAVDAVFTLSADRLARDTLEVLIFIRLCKDSGVALHFGDGSSVETAEDEAMQFFRAYFGQREHSQTAERTLRGKQAAAEAGRMPCGGARRLYGYDYDPASDKLVINEAEAEIVRQVYDWRFDRTPVYRIALRLNEMGIPTKLGFTWEARQIDHMLRNHTYPGLHYYGKARYQKINGKRIVTPKPREEWILIPDYAPAIIDPAVFDAVQELWGDPVSSDRPKHWDYFLGQFLTCGECGGTMGGASKVTKGKLYVYYRCSRTVPTPKSPAVCRARAIPGRELEAGVWSHIEAAIRNPSELIADLRKGWQTGGGNLGKRIARLRRDIQKGKAEQMTMVRQHARGLIAEEVLDALIAPVSALVAKHERDLAALIEQQKLHDSAAQAEERIRACFAQYADGLASLDSAGKVSLMSRLKVAVVATRERSLVTAQIDPKLFTIERTLA